MFTDFSETMGKFLVHIFQVYKIYSQIYECCTSRSCRQVYFPSGFSYVRFKQLNNTQHIIWAIKSLKINIDKDPLLYV